MTRRTEQGHQQAGGSSSPPDSALLVTLPGSMRRLVEGFTACGFIGRLRAETQGGGLVASREQGLVRRALTAQGYLSALIVLLAAEAGLTGVGL